MVMDIKVKDSNGTTLGEGDTDTVIKRPGAEDGVFEEGVRGNWPIAVSAEIFRRFTNILRFTRRRWKNIRCFARS
jgi:hypothetical protein